MKPETITLRDQSSGRGSYHLWAQFAENGDLVIQGQDLGSSVSGFWGSGCSEYEWHIKVRSTDFPKLIAALGGKHGDDVMKLLAERYAKDEKYASQTFLEENEVPIEFSSRMGD